MDVNLVSLSVDWVLFLCLFKVLLIFNADFCFDKDGLCVFGSFRPDCVKKFQVLLNCLLILRAECHCLNLQHVKREAQALFLFTWKRSYSSQLECGQSTHVLVTCASCVCPGVGEALSLWENACSSFSSFQ